MPTYIPGTQADLPKSVLAYLAHSHSEGDRNKRLFRAAQQCHWKKMDQAVAYITLMPRAKQDGLGDAEIREAIASAYRQEDRDPARSVSGGKSSNARTAPHPSASSSSNGEWPDPAELPVPPPGLDLAVLMTTLFGSDGISIGAGVSIIDGKLTIDGGIVKPWERWRAYAPGLASLNRTFGLFFRVNPMRHGTKNDKGVTAFRYALIECDHDAGGDLIPLGVQLALYQKLGLPVKALIFSGGKSLHAIFRIDAADEKQWRERYAFVLSLFPHHAADPQNGNPSRYARLPGFEREEGKMPQLLAVYPDAPDYETWEKQQAAAQSKMAAACRTGDAFLDVSIAPKKIIIDDWLQEGEIGFIFAFRGVGKSWLVMHLCSSIALGQNFGPWNVLAPCPVLYVDGEMGYHTNRKRILALAGYVPENLSILNYEILFEVGGARINLADPSCQQELLQLALDLRIKVIVLDNVSCLVRGVDENKGLEWEKVNQWLSELRLRRISSVLIHHTGWDLSHMRGHTKREDDADWLIRLDNKKEDFEKQGANFISRFTKKRTEKPVHDYEWTFDPDPSDSAKVNIYYTIANRAEIVLQWVRDGLTRCEDIAREMSLSKGRVSQLATQWIKAGKLRKRGRDYEIV